MYIFNIIYKHKRTKKYNYRTVRHTYFLLLLLLRFILLPVQYTINGYEVHWRLFSHSFQLTYNNNSKISSCLVSTTTTTTTTMLSTKYHIYFIFTMCLWELLLTFFVKFFASFFFLIHIICFLLLRFIQEIST